MEKELAILRSCRGIFVLADIAFKPFLASRIFYMHCTALHHLAHQHAAAAQAIG